MAYDYPFRLELSHYETDGTPVYKIEVTGDGKVCTGSNFNLMRRLVDAANEEQANTDRHR